MKFKLIFDTVGYSKKPQGKNAGAITKRMSIDKVKEYSIEEIKENILNGKTIRPSYCGGKEDSWQSQQVFMIDIDNNLTINQAIDKCNEMNIIPNFIYTSFSHKEEHHKFRLVFILDKAITDYNTAKKIQLFLMDMLGEADIQCKNLNRIYFAGKSIVFDSGKILDSFKIIELSKDVKSPSNKSKGKNEVKGVLDNNDIKYIPLLYSTPKTPDINDSGERVNNILNKYNNSSNILFTQKPPQQNHDDSYNIKAISNRDIEYLKGKINNNKIVFDNVSEFWHYVYHNINMAELLEFKHPSSIKCIFHDDHNPSASIFQNDEGVWLYKCHSGKCGLTMNIKQLIEKLGNFKSEYRAIEFIKNIYNLSIKETDWSIEQKANLDSILHKLDMNTFAELCPQTDKNIRYVKDLFSAMIQIAKDNVYGENYMNSDGDVVFFVSLGELAKIMKISPTNIIRISQRIAVLVYHDLIRKLDDDKIPEIMLKKAQALSINNDKNKRINFYSIPSWVFEHLKKVETQGQKWKQYGYTIKGTSYEMFYRAEGLEVAQAIYPQHKKIKSETVDYETGEVITIIKDRTTSKVSNDRVKKILKSINYLIEDKGYTTEKELIIYLSKEYRWEVTEIQLRKMRGELEKLGLKRVRANKEIKNQYGIASEGYPFIIIRC